MEILKNRMILIRKRVLLILFFSFFTTCVISQDNIDFLKKVKTYQDSVKIKRPKQFPNLIDTSTFSISKYLQIFDKLNFPPDLECHYIFIDEETAGGPALYVDKDSLEMESYLERKFREFIKQNNIAKNKITQEFIDLKKYDILCGFASSNNARKYILPNDNETGYLQYLFFNQFGEYFALKWHANHGQKSVIFSNDEMNRLYNYYLGTDLFTCDMRQFEKLLNLNPSPIIKMKKNSCLITWYEIATHRGIYKRSYEISRSAPYAIEKKEDIEILKINTEFIY